ncbi:calmodulin-binding protein 25 [Elaeis guineensis]|uniref:Calmodulin-binding protein 25 n=1 Tax=Elaeis guineensis var. tenera TaxID=51953 RepID=A0A6I9QH13_ELAGV|nr:calmodulin-binding protein 25 [Elaeis guineensis]
MMAENCSTWASWISDAFAHESEALTRALQISLSDDSSAPNLPSSSSSSPSPETLSAGSFLLRPLPATGLDSASTRRRNPIPCSPSTKVSKRKSRASSKRSPTTYINADPANFRQMVQQVTGIRLGDAGVPVEPVLKPEPQRPTVGRPLLPQSCLPTLDTSAFWLDRAGMVGPAAAVHVSSFGPAAVEGPAFDFDPLASFPTLESWSVI